MGEWLNHHNFAREEYLDLREWQRNLGLLPEEDAPPPVTRADEIKKAKENYAKVLQAFSKGVK